MFLIGAVLISLTSGSVLLIALSVTVLAGVLIFKSLELHKKLKQQIIEKKHIEARLKESERMLYEVVQASSVRDARSDRDEYKSEEDKDSGVY